MDRRPLIAGCLLLSALLSGCGGDKLNYSQAVDLADDPADLHLPPDLPLEDLPPGEDLPITEDLPPLIPGCPGLEGLAGEAGCSFVWTHTPVPLSDQRPYALVLHNMDRAQANEVALTDSLVTQREVLRLEPGQIYLWRPERAPALASQELQTGFVEISASRALVVSAHTPWDAEGIGTADSTLVWPEHALGRQHVAASWPGLDAAPPFVTILATQDNTQVTATLPPDTLARGWREERTRSLTLSRGQSWRILGARGEDDLTGTVVTASEPVAVFSGTGCGSTDPDFPLCDHMQHQMPPVEAWGTGASVLGTAFTPGMPLRHRLLAPPGGAELLWGCGASTQTRWLEEGAFWDVPACDTLGRFLTEQKGLLVTYSTQHAGLALTTPALHYTQPATRPMAHSFSSGGENGTTRVQVQGLSGVALWVEDITGARLWEDNTTNNLIPVISLKQGAVSTERPSSLLFYGESQNAGRLWTSGYLPVHRREP